MKKINKPYLTVFVLLSIIILIVAFLVWPLIKDIENNSNELITTKNSITTLSAQTKIIEDFKNNFQVYKTDLERIEQMFIDSGNPVNFIKFLENTSGDHQIISQINLSSSASQDFMSFQVSLTGNFYEVLNFIKKIETGPYLVEIQNLTIKNSANDSDSEISASFGVKAFLNK